ncbi:MAG: hypothetical protein J5838_06610 [Desulfovibrio sp.]|nr:hypothetical protein [Desulfovibrio sp.]
MSTSVMLDYHAIGRRQYSLLMQRDMRRTQRELRRMLAMNIIRRGLEGFAFFSSIAVFAFAFFGWMGA